MLELMEAPTRTTVTLADVAAIAAMHADDVDRDGRFPAEAVQALRYVVRLFDASDWLNLMEFCMTNLACCQYNISKLHEVVLAFT